MDYNFTRERVLASAYRLSGGIKFYLALDMTEFQLRPEDLYADVVERNQLLISMCDLTAVSLGDAIILTTPDAEIIVRL